LQVMPSITLAHGIAFQAAGLRISGWL
jgi:hypothetical protein